jgi:mRNA interferase HigB
MNIYNKSSINKFARKHAECKDALFTWYDYVKTVAWNNPNDVKKSFPKASIVGKGTNLVIFDILDRNYRLVVSINYGNQWVFLKWFGSHSVYDRMDVTKL